VIWEQSAYRETQKIVESPRSRSGRIQLSAEQVRTSLGEIERKNFGRDGRFKLGSRFISERGASHDES